MGGRLPPGNWGRRVPDPVDPLHAELTRLLGLLTEAPANGNHSLADLLTDAAAKCLVKISEGKIASPPPSHGEPQQASVQQQQQIQPEHESKKNGDNEGNKS